VYTHIHIFSVSFKVVTPGGGVSGGADENFLQRRPTDTKRRCKFFFASTFLLLILFPASHHSSLRLHLLFVLPARPHKRKEKFFSSDRGAILRMLAPKYATAPHYEVWGKAPKKRFFVTFPRGPNRSPGGGEGKAPRANARMKHCTC
jgi:hypothetical protein